MENRQFKGTNNCHVAAPRREVKQVTVLGLLEGEQKHIEISYDVPDYL